MEKIELRRQDGLDADGDGGGYELRGELDQRWDASIRCRMAGFRVGRRASGVEWSVRGATHVEPAHVSSVQRPIFQSGQPPKVQAG